MSFMRRDSRFSLEDNWKFIEEQIIEEGKNHGLEIAATTVFDADGSIAGWKLHGWEPITLYTYVPE